MDLQSGVGRQGECRGFDALLDRALLLDLEVSHRGKVLKLGAVLGDSTLAIPGSSSLESIAHPLSKLAAKAQCVLGHNLVRHDLPVLRQHDVEAERQLAELWAKVENLEETVRSHDDLLRNRIPYDD